MTAVVVEFEDNGQDFLEWEIQDGVVIECRPLQWWMWENSTVHTTRIAPGARLDVTTPTGNRITLRHAVIAVRELG